MLIILYTNTGNLNGPTNEPEEVEMLYAIDIFGTEDCEIKLQIKSGNESHCTTNPFWTGPSGSGLYYAKEHTRINSYEFLGDCFRYKISNYTANVTIVSTKTQYLTVGMNILLS